MLAGFFAKQLGNGGSQRASGWAVAQGHMHAGLAVGKALKLHAARVVYSGSGKAVPADALAGFVVDDFGFPLDMRAKRRFGDPAAALVVKGRDAFEVAHDVGQVFQLAPVVVHGLRGAVNDHTVFYKNRLGCASASAEARCRHHGVIASGGFVGEVAACTNHQQAQHAALFQAQQHQCAACSTRSQTGLIHSICCVFCHL